MTQTSPNEKSQNDLKINQEIEDELDRIKKDIVTITNRVSAADNTGLFHNMDKSMPKDIRKDIVNLLTESQEAIKQKNNILASQKCLEVNAKFYDAIHSSTKSWRFVNFYAIPMWIYLVSFLFLIVVLYYFDILLINSSENGFREIAIQSGMWGCIGGILRGLWFLRTKIDKKLWQKTYTVTYLSVPFIGGILGVFIFLILYGGLASISQTFDIKNPLTIFFFAGFAGFSWEWAIELLDKIANIFGKNK